MEDILHSFTSKEEEAIFFVYFLRLMHPAYLQPLVEGLSCSELTRLKALELLGGEGL